MWVEVTGKESGKRVLINTGFVQSVYPKKLNEDAGTVIDFGGDDIYVVEGSYEKIRDLVSEGDWAK